MSRSQTITGELSDPGRTAMATVSLYDSTCSQDTGGVVSSDVPTGAVAIGTMLRSARHRRGLTIEQLSQTTKIPQRLLSALEQGNLAALPGSFYQRAELRTYAQTVGLDPDFAVAQLDRAVAPAS